MGEGRITVARPLLEVEDYHMLEACEIEGTPAMCVTTNIFTCSLFFFAFYEAQTTWSVLHKALNEILIKKPYVGL